MRAILSALIAEGLALAACGGAANTPTAERWWAAFSKAVGPAHTFAPAAPALVSLVLIVATQRHPALRTSRD